MAAYTSYPHGRLTSFVGHMNRVGKQLASSVEHYNRAVGSLERKVLPGARKFVELGIRPKRELEQIEPLESLPRSMIEEMQEVDATPAAPDDDATPASLDDDDNLPDESTSG